jgi:hypothetical protein
MIVRRKGTREEVTTKKWQEEHWCDDAWHYITGTTMGQRHAEDNKNSKKCFPLSGSKCIALDLKNSGHPV